MWPYFLRVALQHFAFGVTLPVVTAFWLEKGLDLMQIALMTTIFFIASIILEIPTGYIADRWGRKTSLVASSATVTIAFGLYAITNNFIYIILGVLIEAASFSLLSGADEAYVYDHLRQQRQEKKYKRILSRLSMTDELATALGMVTSSIIVALGGTMAAFVLSTTILAFTTMVSALTLREPKRTTRENTAIRTEKEFHQPTTFIARATKYFQTHQQIFWAMCCFAVMSEIGRTFWQPQMLAIGLPVASFGLIFATLKLSSLAGAWVGGRAQGNIRPAFFIACSGALGGALLLMSSSTPWIFLVGLALLFFIENIYRLYRSTYLNQRIASSHRARALSAGNMITSLFGAGMTAVLGSVGQMHGLGLVFLILAGIKILGALPFFWQKNIPKTLA